MRAERCGGACRPLAADTRRAAVRQESGSSRSLSSAPWIESESRHQRPRSQETHGAPMFEQEFIEEESISTKYNQVSIWLQSNCAQLLHQP